MLSGTPLNRKTCTHRQKQFWSSGKTNSDMRTWQSRKIREGKTRARGKNVKQIPHFIFPRGRGRDPLHPDQTRVEVSYAESRDVQQWALQLVQTGTIHLCSHINILSFLVLVSIQWPLETHEHECFQYNQYWLAMWQYVPSSQVEQKENQNRLGEPWFYDLIR